MSKSAVLLSVSIKIAKPPKRVLDRFCKKTGRTRTHVAGEAIIDYCERLGGDKKTSHR